MTDPHRTAWTRTTPTVFLFVVSSLFSPLPIVRAQPGPDLDGQATTETSVHHFPNTVTLGPPGKTQADSTWYPRPVLKWKCEVQQLDNQYLIVRAAHDGLQHRLAATRVLSIESSNLSTVEQNAMDRYDAGDHDGAVMALIESLGGQNDTSARPPVWRQQWLSMLAADSAWKSRRAKISLELVSQLDRRPLAAVVLAKLPIAWTKMPRDRAGICIESAREKLSGSSAAVRLVAASWLLQSPTDSMTAANVLAELARDKSRRQIAMLAATLRWRLETPPNVRSNWQDWESKINRMPYALQRGPLSSLVEKMRSAGLDTQAKRIELSLELLTTDA